MNQRRAGEPPPARGGDVRVRITPEEARLLQELILDHCGVSLGADAGFLFERRLGPRLEALSIASFIEYFHYLSYDLDGPAELEECVERITTHETYFFREQFQLDAFRREIVPQLLRATPGSPRRPRPKRRLPARMRARCSAIVGITCSARMSRCASPRQAESSWRRRWAPATPMPSPARRRTTAPRPEARKIFPAKRGARARARTLPAFREGRARVAGRVSRPVARAGKDVDRDCGRDGSREPACR